MLGRHPGSKLLLITETETETEHEVDIFVQFLFITVSLKQCTISKAEQQLLQIYFFVQNKVFLFFS